MSSSCIRERDSWVKMERCVRMTGPHNLSSIHLPKGLQEKWKGNNIPRLILLKKKDECHWSSHRYSNWTHHNFYTIIQITIMNSYQLLHHHTNHSIMNLKLTAVWIFSNNTESSNSTRIIQILSIMLLFLHRIQICFSLLFIAEGHEKRRNWLNSTISTMHFLVEFNHSNHSGFLNSITCWIQPIQPILSLMGVSEKTRLWVSPISFSNEPLHQTLFLMKKFWKSKVTMFWKNWEIMFFRQKPCWIG